MDPLLGLTMLTWIGIALCIAQSAIFSGLNLAVFSISRLQLEVDASTGNPDAVKLLSLRQDSNFVLTTVLWGNVGINVLLTLLSDSVLAGLAAFLFSTVAITMMGEILPQAYFSRNALRMAVLFSPILRFYQWLLFPVAKPVAKLLDWWLGPEGIQYFRERDLRVVIRKHLAAEDVDVDHVEGIGALNFLAIDDVHVIREGEPLDPKSIITLPFQANKPRFPRFERSTSDPLLQQIQASGKKWVVITGPQKEPELVLDADGFLREALFGSGLCNPYSFCHRPIIVRDPTQPLGDLFLRFQVGYRNPEDDVIDNDIILFWGDQQRIITGADILGRLFHGIVTRVPEGLRVSHPHR
jgi:hypothetical protein